MKRLVAIFDLNSLKLYLDGQNTLRARHQGGSSEREF